MPTVDTTGPHPIVDPDDDDRLIGRILTRREVLALLGAGGVSVALAACAPPGSGAPSAGAPAATASPGATSGASAVAASAAPSAASVGAGGLPACVVAPELTEGPYYVDVDLERADIRPNTSDGASAEGAPLELAWAVSQVDGTSCLPLAGAIVDVWHCDALGVYSGVEGSPGTDFLRGFQRTDANGAASFTTIYPGWYSGRAVHIHFKIRTDPDAEAGFEFTSQLFFDDALQPAGLHVGRLRVEGHAGPDEPERWHLQPERRGHAPGRDPGRRHVQDDVRDRGPARLTRGGDRPRELAVCAPAAQAAPDAGPGDHGADDRADGQAAQERAARPLVGQVHARRPAVGPRTATIETSPMPTHATTDAPSRW